MINSRKDYKYYLECDRIALDKDYKNPKFVGDEIWRLQRLMRKAEYYKNCHRTPIGRIYGAWLQYKYYKKRMKLGLSIPINTFGPGLSIAHIGTIVVNGNASVGKNCRIQECVTIGATNGSSKAPQIGDNVFIGSGARIIGGITIANDVAIGANALVVKSILEEGITVGGVPARKISNNNSHRNLCRKLAEEKLL
ncbi:serine O-acetyltransferase [Butyrivibrio sp. JL13D10]|uniref:serine O-acetyltransferase n=1 Tax=Butyrivibrio sp. JL13D10 TaxID=3236815 RepID=UPI0038B4A94D